MRLFTSEVGSRRSVLRGFLLHNLTVFSDAARAFENDFSRLADRDKVVKRQSRTTKHNQGLPSPLEGWRQAPPGASPPKPMAQPPPPPPPPPSLPYTPSPSSLPSKHHLYSLYCAKVPLRNYSLLSQGSGTLPLNPARGSGGAL